MKSTVPPLALDKRVHRHLALCLTVALSVVVSTPMYGQTLERLNVALGAVESFSTRPGVSDSRGASLEVSLPLHTVSVATLGLDLGGVGFVTWEVLCATGPRPCDGRVLPGFEYASLSGRWEFGSRIAPVIRVSAGEWVGRTTNGVPHTTDTGFTGATEVGLRLGRVSPAAGYRVMGRTPQGRADLLSLLFHVAF